MPHGIGKRVLVLAGQEKHEGVTPPSFYQQSLGHLADSRITVPVIQFLEKMGYNIATEDAPAETA